MPCNRALSKSSLLGPPSWRRQSLIALGLGVVNGGAGQVWAPHCAGEQLLGMVGHQLLGDPQQCPHPLIGQAVIDTAPVTAGLDVAAVAQTAQVGGDAPL